MKKDKDQREGQGPTAGQEQERVMNKPNPAEVPMPHSDVAQAAMQGQSAPGQTRTSAANAPGAADASTSNGETTQQNRTPPGGRQNTVSSMLGEITWLMAMSPSHKYFHIADTEWLVMQPILLQQIRMYRDDAGKPTACVLWAKMNEESEQRLLDGATRMRPKDWNSGDRHWIIDVISPQPLNEKLVEDLKASVFKGKSFKFHKNAPDGQRYLVTAEGDPL